MGMNPEDIRMDYCHIELIAGVCGALKPKSILELGYGSGLLTRALLKSICDQGLADTLYTLVDNWQDHDGQMPGEIKSLNGRITLPKFNAITSTEQDFMKTSDVDYPKGFDLLISDADHGKSHLWFPYVLEELIAPNGIGFFHDVCSESNLALNRTYCIDHKIPHFVFDRNSLSGERCERGLLMAMKL